MRAMDTVTDFAKKKNSTVNIDKFVVCGASKVLYVLLIYLLLIEKGHFHPYQ